MTSRKRLYNSRFKYLELLSMIEKISYLFSIEIHHYLLIMIMYFRLIFIIIMSSYCDAFKSKTSNVIDSGKKTDNYFKFK